MPDLTTSRSIKVLIIMAVLLGEFFVSGYFYAPQETVAISENASKFASLALLYSVAGAILTIPIKVIISFFLAGTEITREQTREQIESKETGSSSMRLIGYILIGLCIAFCGYGIAMLAINFNENSLNKWLATYGITFFIEVILIGNAKLLLKILFGLLLMKCLRCQLMQIIAGVCAEKVVSFALKYF